MQYLVMIYSTEREFTGTQEEQKAMMQSWFDYSQWLKDEGVFVAGEALESVNTATTIRGMGAQAVLTDGPFAETKEQLGGFYLIDCENLDAALKYAKPCPGAAYGSIEVRPVMAY